ncbi:MAG: hypothetical protein KC496_01910, partial [Anaerolineae bacterium]|nr:hypothetical protein [Anaerolineae bacterium]
FAGDWQLLPNENGWMVPTSGGTSFLESQAFVLDSRIRPMLRFASERMGEQNIGMVRISVDGADWELLEIITHAENAIDLAAYVGHAVRFQFVWLVEESVQESWIIRDARIDSIGNLPTVVVPITPTSSPSPTITVTASATDWLPPSATENSLTTTPTETGEMTVTPTVEISETTEATEAVTPVWSATPTLSYAPTQVFTLTATLSRTPTISFTPTQGFTVTAMPETTATFTSAPEVGNSSP